MIDAHSHLDHMPVGERGSALERARSAGIIALVVAGVDPPGWSVQRALVAPGVHHAFGLHPWVVAADPDGADACVDQLAVVLARAAPEAVALGEIGLDRLRGPLDAQKPSFRRQLALARERDLPVVLHVVRAHGHALEILRADGLPAAGGMVHGYGGSAESARTCLALGLHLSFGARASRRGDAALRIVPRDRLLIETDGPDPSTLPAVAARVAELRGESPAEVSGYTALNARRLFRLPPGILV